MFSIDKLNPDDALQVKELLSLSWNNAYGQRLKPETIEKVTSVWHNLKALRAQAEDSQSYFGIGSTEAGEMAGLVTVHKLDDGSISMDRLHIHPKFKRRGLGTQLFNKALGAFPESTSISLEVLEFNQGAIDFYLKQGLKIIGRKEKSDLGEVMKVVVMEKEL